MARRGDTAREHIQNTIIATFGDDFVAVQDKKIYVMADDGSGEKIQFAISLTMPKVPVGAAPAPAASHNWDTDAEAAIPHNWDSAPSAAASSAAPQTEVSAEDKAKVDELLKTLGII